MQFTDPAFLFVLLPAACALLYWLTPRFGAQAGMGALLALSLLFYWTWSSLYLELLVLSFTVNFAAACLMPGLALAQKLYQAIYSDKLVFVLPKPP